MRGSNGVIVAPSSGWTGTIQRERSWNFIFWPLASFFFLFISSFPISIVQLFWCVPSGLSWRLFYAFPCRLVSIQNRSFDAQRKLTELRLDYNKISFVNNGTWSGLRDLTILSLRDNFVQVAFNFHSIPPRFMGLSNSCKTCWHS